MWRTLYVWLFTVDGHIGLDPHILLILMLIESDGSIVMMVKKMFINYNQCHNIANNVQENIFT